jgi:tyrosine-specific transport protein
MTIHKSAQGSVLGGILLLSGSAIGAGMLGLPLVSGAAGFWPSMGIFLFCWVFMSITALLLLEVNLFSGKDSNIISMAYNSLGNIGKYISLVIYVFLIYSMLVAYVDASGGLVSEILNRKLDLKVTSIEGSLFFCLLFGLFVFLGTLFVDRLNRLLMLGLILTYILLMVFGAPSVHAHYLDHKVWGYSLLAIPVVITSFGYHNIIPTLTGYLRGSKRRMVCVILLGGVLPLVIYALWELLILGVVPFEVFDGSPTLEYLLTYIPESRVSLWTQYFAFFAIVTSFLAQALALLDFLRDALKVKKSVVNRFWLTLLVLIPPFFLSLKFPGIFITALSYVGGFAAIILFALIPAFMVWELRYKRKELEYKIVPGGKAMLACIIFVSLCIILLQFLQELLSLPTLKEYL